jgi:gamma-glutamylputrescine oxidase
VEHIRSYYAASANPSPARPALQGDVTADVCVIGAGISGCSTALHLAERGYKVAVLEGRRVAWGASGRSGGQAIFGYAAGQDKLIAQVGKDAARQMFDMSVEALDLLKGRVARHAIDCDLSWGQMHVAIKPRHATELRAWQEELATQYGYRSLRWLDAQEVRQVLATQHYSGGLLDTRSGHLHPLNYTLGLAAAVEAAGAKICEESLVTGIEHGATVTVRTAAGSVQAKHVVLCCNAYIDATVSSKLRARIMPVGTYIVATEPLGEARMRALVRDNVAVTDINWVLDYFRRSADHRLLFGGRVSYSGLNPATTHRATRAHAQGVPAARRREDRLRVGRLRGHHDEPRAGFWTTGTQRVLPAGLLGPRHCAYRHGGQARRRDDRGTSGALRPVRKARAPRLSGRTGVAHTGAGAGDALVPAEGPVVGSSTSPTLAGEVGCKPYAAASRLHGRSQ